MTDPMPTRPGDVLILWTDTTFSIHAVGQVSTEGQQHFDCQSETTYERDRETAVGLARRLVAPGGRIFLQHLDTDDWYEISATSSGKPS
jgi:hypothetical protein